MRRLDHVVHAVGDLDEAADAYRRAGFVVTERADHPFGTSNRLVLFDGSYLELVAVTRPDRIPPPAGDRPSFGAAIRRFLDGGEGGAMFVLGSDQPDTDRTLLAAAGLEPNLFSFSRPAPQPDGSVAEVSFDVVFVDALGPGCGVFLCHHRTPGLIWRSEYLRHPNGASQIREVVLVGDAADTNGLEVLAASHATPVPGGLMFPLDGAAVTVVDADTYRDRFGVAPPDRPPPALAAAVVAGSRPVSTTIAGLHVAAAPC